MSKKNLLNTWIKPKKNFYQNKFKLRALDVAKRVSEYSVIYGNESTVLSLILAVGIAKEEDHCSSNMLAGR